MKKQTKKTKVLKNGHEISIVVDRQGAPIAHAAIIRDLNKNLVALEILMKSKYCEIFGAYGGDENDPPGISIFANKSSLILNKKVKKGEPTYVSFPDFGGWDVYATGAGRYGFRVCLLRKQKSRK